MKSSITLAGIEQAISNLNYRNSTIKYRVVHAIRQFYTSEDSIAKLKIIDLDILIKIIWDSADVKSKRRNLTSIRSSINSDLNKLYDNGRNPEGIIINASNVFDMSETAKSNLLNSFSNALNLDDNTSLNQITNALQAISNFLSEKKTSATYSNEKLDKIKNILKSLSETVISAEPEHEDERSSDGKPNATNANQKIGNDESSETVDDSPNKTETGGNDSGTLENTDASPPLIRTPIRAMIFKASRSIKPPMMIMPVMATHRQPIPKIPAVSMRTISELNI